MAEQEEKLVVKRGKKYKIAPELLNGTPMYHANHVMFSVNNNEVGITFAVRLDSLQDEQEETGVAFPQA